MTNRSRPRISACRSSGAIWSRNSRQSLGPLQTYLIHQIATLDGGSQLRLTVVGGGHGTADQALSCQPIDRLHRGRVGDFQALSQRADRAVVVLGDIGERLELEEG